MCTAASLFLSLPLTAAAAVFVVAVPTRERDDAASAAAIIAAASCVFLPQLTSVHTRSMIPPKLYTYEERKKREIYARTLPAHTTTTNSRRRQEEHIVVL